MLADRARMAVRHCGHTRWRGPRAAARALRRCAGPSAVGRAESGPPPAPALPPIRLRWPRQRSGGYTSGRKLDTEGARIRPRSSWRCASLRTAPCGDTPGAGGSREYAPTGPLTRTPVGGLRGGGQAIPALAVASSHAPRGSGAGIRSLPALADQRPEQRRGSGHTHRRRCRLRAQCDGSGSTSRRGPLGSRLLAFSRVAGERAARVSDCLKSWLGLRIPNPCAGRLCRAGVRIFLDGNQLRMDRCPSSSSWASMPAPVLACECRRPRDTASP